MEKRYTEIMEHIYPTQSQKNRMLEKVFEPEPVRRRKFKLRYCITALAVCIIFSTTVFAEEIKNTFYNFFGKNELVSEEVLNDVYTDSDEHVTMTVKEVLSDRINCHAIVEYTIHDEKGRKFLDSYSDALKNNIITYTFIDITPKMEAVNRSYGCNELTEYRTENTRVFDVFYEASGEAFNADTIDLEYRMCDKFENHATINISKSVEIKDIKLDSSLAPDKCYKPLGVKISAMGIYIYGKNCGQYECGSTSSGGWYCRILTDESIDSLYIVMKDGTKHDMIDNNVSYSALSAVTNEEFDYDLGIYCSAFNDYIDISTVDGIELDSVYYPLGL